MSAGTVGRTSMDLWSGELGCPLSSGLSLGPSSDVLQVFAGFMILRISRPVSPIVCRPGRISSSGRSLEDTGLRQPSGLFFFGSPRAFRPNLIMNILG
jgi:hypothetical protein